jgi:rhamnosyltransferase subunit B
MGTAAETMRCGKPAICFPFAHDQFDNAARIERLGLGRMRGQNDISLSDMKDVLAETLNDPCIAQRAHEFAASISADDFPETIRGVVEGVLRHDA